jgi:hypothetical protein
MVPILDTPGFSVSLGVGAIRKVKKLCAGRGIQIAGKKYGGGHPSILEILEQGRPRPVFTAS